MIKLSVDQHAQVLGFALIGYGIGWALDAIAALWNVGQIPALGLEDSIQFFLTSQILILLARAIVAVTAGLVIRMMMSDPKIFGLLFVFASVSSFPLGTVLSAYVLIYLFAIYPTEFDGGVSSVVGIRE